jgi:hypothetical protein
MNRSESITELSAALAKAQGAIRAAPKEGEASGMRPGLTYHYATLADVWSACRAALAANGLAVVQSPRLTTTSVEVETLLAHSSGQWLSSLLEVPLAQRTAHAIGSAITYARRYSLAAMVGVVADDDDDAQAAQPRLPTRTEALDASREVGRTARLKAKVAAAAVEAAPVPPPPDEVPPPTEESAPTPTAAQVPFGRHKGVPVTELSMEQLAWYQAAAEAELGDFTKARFHGRTREWLAAVVAEVSARRAEVAP